MEKEELALYRQLYQIVSDPLVNDLIVKYAKIEYDKAVKGNRSKREVYEFGYNNGNADAWQHILSLKQKLQDILKNV